MKVHPTFKEALLNVGLWKNVTMTWKVSEISDDGQAIKHKAGLGAAKITYIGEW